MAGTPISNACSWLSLVSGGQRPGVTGLSSQDPFSMGSPFSGHWRPRGQNTSCSFLEGHSSQEQQTAPARDRRETRQSPVAPFFLRLVSPPSHSLSGTPGQALASGLMVTLLCEGDKYSCGPQTQSGVQLRTDLAGLQRGLEVPAETDKS